MKGCKKIVIIHPGVQHAYRLANALERSRLFKSVHLFTWFLIKKNSLLSKVGFFRKRVKDIDGGVNLRIFPLFELLYNANQKFYFFLFPKKQNTNYNNIQYIWSILFGCFLIPYVYFHRKNLWLVVYDTCAWPLSYYAKKWGVTVILDFPSISHESAIRLGIDETGLGISIKEKERRFIDYALFCSDFANSSYSNKTSAKQCYTAHVGAELKVSKPVLLNKSNEVLQIAFIANMELRKGLDFLLKASKEIKKPFKLHLIGKISKSWVSQKLVAENLNSDFICFAGPFNQTELTNYLKDQAIDLNVLPSRFDSFGMVVPETMMLGIPNIVSPFVGAGEKIVSGKSGYVMKELDSGELAKLINNYSELDLAQKNRLRTDTYQQSKLMTWEQYSFQIHAIFEEMLVMVEEKIAFLVTHPTQFEVPFYQYISTHPSKISLEVIYIDTDLTSHFDKELKKEIDWGIDLFEGYKFSLVKSRKELRKLLRDRQFDLLITNGYNGKYFRFLDILLFRTKKLALRIDSIVINQPAYWKIWKAPILKVLFKLFNHFFAVGTLTKDYLAQLGVPKQKINFFSYSIDDTKFAKPIMSDVENLQVEYGLQRKKVFLCVSKLVKREIPMDIIKAFIKASNPNWVLLVVGDGEDRSSTEKFCANFPKADVKFVGYINYVDLPAYYHLADVFVHTAREENWGVSVHEAIAANCTVISSDTVGSSYDLITHEKNGYIYQYGDTTSLEAYLKKALLLHNGEKKEINESKLKKWGYAQMWRQIQEGVKA